MDFPDWTDSNSEFLNDDEDLDYDNHEDEDEDSDEDGDENIESDSLFSNLIAQLRQGEDGEEEEVAYTETEYEIEDENMEDTEQAILLYPNYLLFASPRRRYLWNGIDDDENDSARRSNQNVPPSKKMGAELLKSGNFGIVESLYRDEMSGRRVKQQRITKCEYEEKGDTSAEETQNKEKSVSQQTNGEDTESKGEILHPKANITRKILDREVDGASGTRVPMGIAKRYIPNSDGETVDKYRARAYSGQFSQDGSFFYTCCQDFTVHIYDTSDPSHFIKKKVIKGQASGWTITDANLSPDNEWIIYSSISPVVYLAKTSPYDNFETPLNFTTICRGIFSVRFSGDGRELVAGGRIDSPDDKCIYVYDIESRRIVLSAGGHEHDVNAVCFVDESSNVLLSGSDDSFIKVWDRRSMRGERPSGILVGHTEGITFVSSKGDGRYCISNGKDQKMKLWDIRMMISQDDFSKLSKLDGVDYRQTNWDYRTMAGLRTVNHPNDCSVQTYCGHKVLKTLIRCHFSPIYSTGQQYVYSGSTDGRVHIYRLDGTIAKVLKTQKSAEGSYRRYDFCVRDVSWHPYLPVLISTSWTDDSGGVVIRHEYKVE